VEAMNDVKQRNMILGIILICVGVLLFLHNFHIHIRDVLLLGVGIVLFSFYFIKKKTGFLLAGIILMCIGIAQFLYSMRFIDEDIFKALFFTLLGVAFLILYFVKKQVGYIFPGFILLAFGIYFYIMQIRFVDKEVMWPLIFMIMSAAFLFIFVFEFQRLGYKPLVVSVLLLLAGTLAFLTVRGIIDKKVWENFWPVLLVTAGVLVIVYSLFHKSSK